MQTIQQKYMPKKYLPTILIGVIVVTIVWILLKPNKPSDNDLVKVDLNPTKSNLPTLKPEPEQAKALQSNLLDSESSQQKSSFRTSNNPKPLTIDQLKAIKIRELPDFSNNTKHQEAINAINKLTQALSALPSLPKQAQSTQAQTTTKTGQSINQLEQVQIDLQKQLQQLKQLRKSTNP